MAESSVFPVFGIKSFVLVNSDTGLPYGRYRVLGGGEISVSADRIPLQGGAQRWSWATEWGTYDAELTLTVREYPEMGFRMIAQGTAVITAAETSGNVSSITNKQGSSIVNGTEGITSVTANANVGNLKTGHYIVEAQGTGSIDVFYVGSDYDSYENDTLKITATALDIPGAAGTTTISSWGLDIAGASGGTANFTQGDTGTFDVREVNTGNELIEVGKANETVKEFEAYLFSEDQKTGDQFYVYIPKCSASGLPISFTEKEFSEAEITLSIDYSSSLDFAYKVFKIEG